jgi:hypothetical protein
MAPRYTVADMAVIHRAGNGAANYLGVIATRVS